MQSSGKIPLCAAEKLNSSPYPLWIKSKNKISQSLELEPGTFDPLV